MDQIETIVTGRSKATYKGRQASAVDDLLAGYRPEGQDDVYRLSGTWQPGIRPFIDALDEIQANDLRSRWTQAQRTIADNGIAYNIRLQGSGDLRPWTLDPLPLVLSQTEWQKLEEGIQQRTNLMEALAEDTFGSRQAMKDGILPKELVLANPRFLRACATLPLPGSRALWFSAMDLVRQQGGTWQVMQDMVQSPSGAGFALENRLLCADVLSEAYKACHAPRLAVFFKHLLKALYGLAPRYRDNPRIVLMTAGSYSPTYFEQSFLARYLGITLVEGNDLTVRPNGVYLKALDGLYQVDVILRRVNDWYCDPLELADD